MSLQREQVVQIIAWLLGLTVCIIGFVAWGMDNNWQLLPFNTYQVFPLLGILAFSLMWTHYVLARLREVTEVKKTTLKSYYQLTGYVVLLLICLHPGLLIYQRFVDGAGLPPGSYTSYVAPGLGWVSILGTISLFVFLAFELHRKFGEKPWFQYVRDASDPAMLAIAYHGLRLGSNLQQGWFKYIWWFYTISIFIIIIRKYTLRLVAWQKNENLKTRL